MASLDKLASLMNVDMNDASNLKSRQTELVVGQKRRAWIVQSENEHLDNTSISSEISNEISPQKGVYRPLNEKGSINRVHQSDSSTGFINRIDQHEDKKGFINRVSNPLNLTLENLRGNPLKIIQYLFAIATYEGECTTRKVTLSELMQALEISRDSARTGLRFLLKNNLLVRINFQPGKTGWSQYSIKKSLFLEITDAQKKGSINPILIASQYRTEKGSNSSSNIITTTIETIDPLSWEDVDVEPVAEIGFSVKHLLQLKQKNSPQVVQESINHFAFGLEFNNNTMKYKDPVNVLMGVLRKGGAWIEPNYKSSQEIAQERLLEQKRAEHARLAKMHEELLKMEFDEWLLTIDDKKKSDLVKDRPGMTSLPTGLREKTLRGYLWEYFKNEIKK